MTTNVKIVNEGPGTVALREVYDTEDKILSTDPIVVLPKGGEAINYVWKGGRGILITEEEHN